jgi:hypothetical protein
MALVDMQQVVTFMILLLAAGYLVRRTWRRLAGRQIGGCGSCSVCPLSNGAGSSSATPLVPLHTLIASARRQAEEGGTGANEPPPERLAE